MNQRYRSKNKKEYMIKSIKNQSKPGAWIVNPDDKGRKSIKSGKCFLKDDSYFEIELFNPLTVSVLSDIKLNGQSISETGLVLKPGQRVYLDCFIDDRKKFIFKTYDVEDSKEALDAIQNNGLLEVFFYKEDVITLSNWKPRFDKIIVEKWYPYPTYPNFFYTYNSGTTGTINCNNTLTTTNSDSIIGTTTNTAYYSSTNSITMGSAYSSNGSSIVNLSNCSNLTPINSVIETGRVEKGDKSKQKFTDVNMDFENNYIHSVIIQILPESRKPAQVKEVFKKSKKFPIKNENSDIIDLIKKLADLHSSGILTDEEFKNKKSELLNKI